MRMCGQHRCLSLDVRRLFCVYCIKPTRQTKIHVLYANLPCAFICSGVSGVFFCVLEFHSRIRRVENKEAWGGGPITRPNALAML